MILGQLLDGVCATTTTYYSPWFPRGGNLAKFTCQVFAFDGLSGGGEKLQIGVETKNSEESDKDAVLMSGTVTITLTILASTTWEAGANLSWRRRNQSHRSSSVRRTRSRNTKTGTLMSEWIPRKSDDAFLAIDKNSIRELVRFRVRRRPLHTRLSSAAKQFLARASRKPAQ